MVKKLFVLALCLLAVNAFAQKRYLVAPGQEALLLAPGEDPVKAAVNHGLTNVDKAAAACPTTVNAGYFGTRNTNFTFNEGDVLAERIVAPVTGTIKQIFFRSYTGRTMIDTTTSVRIMVSTVQPTDIGAAATTWIGYYSNSSDPTGHSPYKDDTGADTNFVAGTVGAKDPNGVEIWGYGGFVTSWPNANQWNAINTIDGGLEPTVNKGDAFNVCMRVPYETQATRPADYNYGGTNGSGIVSLWKYYKAARLATSDWGWWSRVEYYMSVYVVIEATGDLPPSLATVSGVNNTTSTNPQPVTLTAYDCNAANAADTGVASANLWYRVNLTGSYTALPMTYTAGTGWHASIPGQAKGTIVQYYCDATDIHSNTSSPSTVTKYRVVDFNANRYTTTFPAISWIDLTTTGTMIPPSSFFNTSDPTDDGTAGPFDIGTGFKGFFGQDTLRYAWVGLNGAITLSKTQTDTIRVGSGYSSFDPPTSSAPRNFIGAWWNDLFMTNPGGGHGSIWTGTSGSKFIVEYYKIGNFNSAGDTLTTFEVILDASDNSITVQFLNVGNTTLPTDGMIFLQWQNAENSILFLNRFGYPVETLPANNTAIKMVYTPAAVPETKEVPKVFALYNNYPNPFNPSTEISFSIPTASQVRLSVYNLLGQEVATLVNEFKNAGTYTVPFSANGLASGVYFYSIKAGNHSDVKKMVLMK
jgi:hypothetical protein